MKFEISRDLGHFTGGVFGKAMLYSMGYDGFVVNNEFSVIVSADHCSVKSFGDKKIRTPLLKKIAEYLKYQSYHIEQHDTNPDFYYIYKD